MINIQKTCEAIEARAASENLKIIYTGASNKSDSVYLSIEKPREICAEYGILECFVVHVRISNHFNTTNTFDKLASDFYVNIYREDEIDILINDAFEFLAQCETKEV